MAGGDHRDPCAEIRAGKARSSHPPARQRGPTRVISRAAAPTSLPTRRFATARAHGSAAPDCGTPRCAQPGRPGSWTVVRSPPSRTSSAAVTAATRGRTGRSRRARSSAGDGRSGSNRTVDVRPIRCQPPGIASGYTAGLRAGDADAARRDALRGLARRGSREGVGQPAQVSEPGRKAKEQDR